jgi:E3 ubiquitin-protein ligase HECTD4
MSREAASVYMRASVLSWAAFRVLAARCAAWEKVDTSRSINASEECPSNNALPIQISTNVTNHLARATNLVVVSHEDSQSSSENYTCVPSLTEAIQDVLGLLSSLQQYRIGKAILKQSPCVCRLLSLLQDPRLSPRMVLTILKLLNTALPLVDNLDGEYFSQILQNKKQPSATGSSNEASTSSQAQSFNPYNQVASLLLSKLADFLVSGSQNAAKSENSIKKGCNLVPDTALSSSAPVTGLLDPSHGKINVWVHKRPDQLGAPMLRQIFLDNSRTDLRPSRANMGQLETELNADGKLFLYTEDASTAERKAMRLAQLGCIVSLEPAAVIANEEGKQVKASPQPVSSEAICKGKNSQLANWDPPRPFISGQVAECLASEIVQLLHALLNSSNKLIPLSEKTSDESVTVSASQSALLSESQPTQTTTDIKIDLVAHLAKQSLWPTAVEQVISSYLKPLPKLLAASNPTSVPLEPFVFSGRLAIASLTILGAFTETIRPGAEVWIVEDSQTCLEKSGCEDLGAWEFIPTKTRVLEVSEVAQTAQVETVDEKTPVRIWTVPLTRLVPCHNGRLPESKTPTLSNSAMTEIAAHLRALLTLSSASKPDNFALKKQLPSLSQIVTAAGITSAATIASSKGHVTESRAIAQGMTVVRMVAEMRTRCMQVLSELLKNKEFSDTFIGLGEELGEVGKVPTPDTCTALQSLKSLAKECQRSHRIKSVEAQVAWMRLLYRDCTRPPKLSIAVENGDCQINFWNISKTFPKVRSCIVSTSTNSVVYVGMS